MNSQQAPFQIPTYIKHAVFELHDVYPIFFCEHSQ